MSDIDYGKDGGEETPMYLVYWHLKEHNASN